MAQADDKLVSAADMQLGQRLAQECRTIAPQDCPTLEKIAAFVDCTLAADEREHMLAHFASCDACYHTLLLSANDEGAHVQALPLPKKIWALAATIAIAVVSLVVYFHEKPAIRAGQEMNQKNTGRDAKILAAAEPQRSLLPPAGELKVRAGTALPDREQNKIAAMQASKGAPLQVRAADKEAADQMRKTAATRGKDQLPEPASYSQTTANVEKPIDLKNQAAVAEIAGKIDAVEERTKAKTTEPGAKNVAQGGMQNMMQNAAAPYANNTQTNVSAQQSGALASVQNQVQLNAANAPADKREQIQASAAPAKKQDADSLLRRQRETKTAVSDNELQQLFKDSVVAALQNKNQVDGEGATTRSAKMRSEPVLLAHAEGQTAALRPNIGYFLSNALPGSFSASFFALAHAGWCYQDHCFGGSSPIPDWQRPDLSDRQRIQLARKLMIAWQTLQPNLHGMMLDIANATIAHLKNQ